MFRVVGIGELLWDLLPTGAQIGGAPANYAYHAGALGAEARTISRVGADPLGRALITQLDALGVSTQCVQVDDASATGTVAVEIDASGQPHYHITPDVAWDRLLVTPDAMVVASSADAICFGTLAQRNVMSRDAIRTLVAASPADALRILDVNLRQQYFSPALIDESLTLATVLKVNDVELPQLAAMFGLTGSEQGQMVQIAKRWQLRAVALTRGDKGSALLTAHAWSEHPGVRVTVADTIGAGDAFTAAMTLGLLKGWSLDEVNAQANLVAAYVASQAGGTPALPADVSTAFVGTR
jgi:fructokinase